MQPKPQPHAVKTLSNASLKQLHATNFRISANEQVLTPFQCTLTKLTLGTDNCTSSERTRTERFMAGCFREMREVVVEGGLLFSDALAAAVSNQTNTHTMRANGSGREELVGQSTSSLFRKLVENLKPGVLDEMSMRSAFLDVVSRHVVAIKRPGSTWSVSVDGSAQHANPGKSTLPYRHVNASRHVNAFCLPLLLFALHPRQSCAGITLSQSTTKPCQVKQPPRCLLISSLNLRRPY